MPSRTSAAPALLILIAIMAVGFGTLARLYDPERMVVWHDEVFSLVRSSGYDETEVRQQVFSGRGLSPSDLLAYQRPSPDLDFSDTIASLKTHPEHGPLYFALARAAMPVSESSLLASRGTSLTLSLLLIPAVFWLAWELFKDSRAAWIAAALAATSPLHLLYAQEARQYALWTVLAAASSAALMRAVRRGGLGPWSLYGLLVTLGLYTHLLFLLVLAAHGVYVLYAAYRRRREARSILRGSVVAVTAAGLLFSPWLWVMTTGVERVRAVTAWMNRPMSAAAMLESWGSNLARTFVDIPDANRLLLLGLIPLSWVLWRFCTRAPAPSRLFVCALFLTFLAAVLGPDLAQGGSRSLYARYALPAFLAVQIAVAFVLGAGWDAPRSLERIAARLGLILLLGLALRSDWLILHADTWWNKNFSEKNKQVAALINQTERPLIVIRNGDIGLGEAISIAYDLNKRALFTREPEKGETLDAGGFSDLFLLTPSAELLSRLSARYELSPMLGTWQWYRAVPKP